MQRRCSIAQSSQGSGQCLMEPVVLPQLLTLTLQVFVCGWNPADHTILASG